MTYNNMNWQFTWYSIPGGLRTPALHTSDALFVCAKTNSLFGGIQEKKIIQRPDKVCLSMC